MCASLHSSQSRRHFLFSLELGRTFPACPLWHVSASLAVCPGFCYLPKESLLSGKGQRADTELVGAFWIQTTAAGLRSLPRLFQIMGGSLRASSEVLCDSLPSIILSDAPINPNMAKGTLLRSVPVSFNRVPIKRFLFSDVTRCFCLLLVLPCPRPEISPLSPKSQVPSRGGSWKAV